MVSRVKIFTLIKKRSKKVGLPPGTLVYIGDKPQTKVKISIIDYNEDNFEFQEDTKLENCFAFKKEGNYIRWIKIDGVNNIQIVEEIGKFFNFHPLLLEDIVTPTQRPKLEEYESGNYLYIVVRMLHSDKNLVESEQMSLIIGSNYVITFQEVEGDVFDNIRDHLRSGKGKLRRGGSDNLAYALLDAIVDDYYVGLEKISERLETVQEKILETQDKSTLEQIYDQRREILYLYKIVWPLRDMNTALQKSESILITEKTKVYLRDISDHINQIIDSIDTFREVLNGITEIYLSSGNFKLNEIIKILTIYSTIFMPLSFIASLYGMNLIIPEFRITWFYPVLLFIMGILTLAQLLYFKKKKWI